MSKKFLFLFLIFFLPQQLFASSDHGSEHSQIFHAFTLEADAGEARDGKSRSLDLSGWVGGDYNRLWLRGEKKIFGDYDKKTEFQALYSRNIAQFWDAQIGWRNDDHSDFSSHSVDYLVVGLEGLSPYFFETVAQIFVSEEENFSARWKQEIDLLLTQKLIVQPYFEADLYAQDVPELEVKSGLAELELGVVTRYEISRKFAPYFALRYNSKTFGTKDSARQNNEKTDNVIVAVGLRLRF